MVGCETSDLLRAIEFQRRIIARGAAQNLRTFAVQRATTAGSAKSMNSSMSPPMRTESATVDQLIRHGAQRFEAAGLWFGHGSDNAFDEAAELVLFGAGLRHEDAPGVYDAPLSSQQRDAVLQLFDRRIRERLPAAYLTRRMWFAGLEFYVDERVLVPRSPLAELIEARFEPWIQAGRIRSVLDIGTGSGCIAIATALALPDATVDAADISEAALAVTKINIERHQVAARVRAVQSDVFAGLEQRQYDVIVTNPPYVGDEEMQGLPAEYHGEPALGLRGGRDGLDIVRRILAGASDHLRPGGILVVEVGNSETALSDAFPRVPFTWLEFARGGGGVFLLACDQLRAHRALFGRS
jgi:ribosomal protein L3 glutamine methyltransferase